MPLPIYRACISINRHCQQSEETVNVSVIRGREEPGAYSERTSSTQPREEAKGNELVLCLRTSTQRVEDNIEKVAGLQHDRSPEDLR